MLKDVTFGQYYPTESPVHRLDPRVKILLVIAYIVGIFLVESFFLCSTLNTLCHLLLACKVSAEKIC